jgi:predicted permease
VRLRDLMTRRRHRDEDLEAEIASHLALAARDREADGAEPRAAYLAARKDFGNVTLTAEATRHTWRGSGIERLLDIARDASYALRLVRRSPSYSLVIVTVLAVGIAANVIAFSLFKSLTIAPLAGVRNSGSLTFIGPRTSGGQVLPMSFPEYEYVRDHGLPELAAWAIQPFVLGADGAGQPVIAELVTGNYFSVLDVKAEQGRTLLPGDAARGGAPPVVVLSHGVWQRSFGSDPEVIGRTIRINAQPMTVVGVAAASFHGAVVGIATDLFIPITMQPPLMGRNWIDDNGNRWVHPFMHPPAGPRERLQAQVAAISRGLAETDPRSGFTERATLVSVWRWPFGAQSIMLPAASLIGAMALLLLVVVSANVGGLVLVRSLARRAEMAARLTLGASRGRVLRQLLIESLVLAIPGAAIGFLLPRYAESYISAAAERVPFPLYFNVEPDRYVVAFTVLLAIASAVAYSLLPAIRLSHVNLGAVLKDHHQRGSAKSRLRTVLVVAQVAVGLMLLVGTALVIRTLDAAQRADAGFDARNVTWATFDALAGGLDEPRGRQVYRDLLDAVRAESGVTAATMATFLPLNMVDLMGWSGEPEGYQKRSGEDVGFAVNIVGTDYFRTLGIPLLAGREFTADDEGAPEPPLIVNETFAKRFWGSAAAAIGRHVRIAGRNPTVVGVARDIKYARLDEEPRPYVYAPFSHYYVTSMTLHVRAAADEAAVLQRVRAIVHGIDPSLVVLASGPLDDQLRTATSLYETVARIMVMIGALAALLAALGVYGLVAYTVKQRAQEIGVRTAIGATRGMILRHFLARGMMLSSIGVMLGALASIALSRFMSRMLFGVAATDTASFVGASALLLAAAIAASFVPAWRASRADPLAALRHQ